MAISGPMFFSLKELCIMDENHNVLYDFERVDILRELASTLVERIFALTDGQAAHIGRGRLCALTFFTMELFPQAHVNRVNACKRLVDGRPNLVRLPGGYDVPGGGSPDQVIPRFYISTDERDPAILDLFRREGAVLMDDLLTLGDRHRFARSDRQHAWALMISDLLGVVEQLVLLGTR
ncbi:hypothetical protein BDZ89DRAFT_1243892 [Hymenopellis radicata]|nr:hypothetical protein BDZ89DRAFT_1243892 [Hymenopellis radicata]